MAKRIPDCQLPSNVTQAIKCGPEFSYRDWRKLPIAEMTRAEKAMAFVEKYHPIPDGPLVGQFVKLLPFQEALFYQAIDTNCWQLVVSMARKNAKTETIARIINCYLLGPLAEQNSNIAVAANSRDQAAHLFTYLVKSLQLSPELNNLYRVVPSSKKIIGLNKNVTFQCLSADAKNAHGGQYKIIVVDELGQHVGPLSPFYDALVTGQGTQAEPKMLILSTQAASDADLLSTIIDGAIKTDSQKTAVHLYAANDECSLEDESQWLQANPALGYFRSKDDIIRQCADAKAIPAAESRFRLLILNQRVALESLFLASGPYKLCSGEVDFDVFRNNPTAIALDLSARGDLTAACIAARADDGVVHIFPFVWCPTSGIESRELRDRAPYTAWVKSNHLIPLGGKTMEYDQIAAYLRDELYELGISPQWVVYDRWGIQHFRKAASDEGFAMDATWVECGQGYKDFSPRCKNFEALILNGKIRHGGHPLLAMAFSNAVAEVDASGNVKLAKNKSTQRIDPAVAAVMAAFQVSEGNLDTEFNVASLIG
jgi:phage terminase large subunit-like protein